MKRLAVIVLSLLPALAVLNAQNEEIARLQSLLQDSRVSAEYSFTYGGKLKCNGIITIQDPCYMASGNGIEVYCDGYTRWTVDRDAKEVYVENTSGPRDYLQYLSDISELKIGKVTKEPRSDTPEFFMFDEKVLDSVWIVTDLR